MYPNNLCADVRPGEQGYLPDPVADIFMVHDVRTILLSPPVDGRVSSFYGWRMDPLSGLKRFHSGLDFAGVPGDEVFAAAGGKVVHTGPTSGCGLAVTIEHKGEIITRYCHLSHIGVATGEEVQGGGIIGAVGSTGRSHGPHLHFELWEGDHPTDPSPKIALLD